MSTQTVEAYLKLPYTIEIVREETDDYSGWFARVVELPGCMTQADTFDELGGMIIDAMQAWIETALETGQSIPEPRQEEAYSGKFVVRLPRSLHRELAEAADRDNVSLNAFVSAALSKAIGANVSVTPDPAPTFAPNWPRLSVSATNAMRAAGVGVEADNVNELLFANWLDKVLQQLQAAIDGKSMQDAMAHHDLIRQALARCKDHSPLMSAFFDAVRMLGNQIAEVNQLRAGIAEVTTMSDRFKAQAQSYRVLQETLLQRSYDPLIDTEVKYSSDEIETLRKRE